MTQARSERGAVMVIVAAWLPVLALFAMFAIDVSHWFDYSRNLQNRADAAALAAGTQYAGPPNGTPDTPNLPYPFASISPYYNQPNLTKGTPNNFHMLLNSTDYWPSGVNWTMGTVCSATDEDGATAPMVDVRVTQASLGLFFPLLNIQPNISAHARVELEGAAGTGNVTPIAVRESNVKCAAVNFVDTSTGTSINAAPVALTKEGADPSNGATIWDIPNGTSVTMPGTAGHNVYVQVVVNDCGSKPTPTSYDSTSGVLLINNYPATAQTPSTAPVIDTGGVVLTGTCSPDQYFFYSDPFSPSSCDVNVTAHVAFPSDGHSHAVTAIDHYIDPTTLKPATQSVTLSNSGGTWTSDNPLTIDGTTGRHQIEITWADGAAKGTFGVQQQTFSACDSAIYDNCADIDPNTAAVWGNDSGPIRLAQLSTCDTSNTPPTCSGGSGANAFAANSNHTFDLTLETGTIANARAGQPPTILRFSESGAGQTFNSHATGLINCGQGQGNNQAIAAVANGCPTVGTAACTNLDFCAPLALNLRADVCTPAGNQLGPIFEARTTTNGAPVDCIQTVGGTKSPLPQGIACRIITNATPDPQQGCNLPNGNNNICSSNNWSNTKGGEFISGDDPRAMTMVISAPEDLNKNNEVVPIHNFGVFYVVGWDTKGAMSKYNCDSYTAAPDPSVENSNYAFSGAKQGEVFGYWIKDTIPDAIPSGTACDPALFGACTPALTR
jgi:hypothetical protein